MYVLSRACSSRCANTRSCACCKRNDNGFSNRTSPLCTRSMHIYPNESQYILLQAFIDLIRSLLIPQAHQMHPIEQILPFRLCHRFLFQQIQYRRSHCRPYLFERWCHFSLLNDIRYIIQNHHSNQSIPIHNCTYLQHVDDLITVQFDGVWCPHGPVCASPKLRNIATPNYADY